ncbi:MAG: dienelactone hydrolase family protein [Acidobacteriaceae bacterium]|nr:dienelactone hydrolase family protein [Acidobacteriaceae bacterium]
MFDRTLFTRFKLITPILAVSRSAILVLGAALAATPAPEPYQLHEQQIRIPWAKAAPVGLDALLVYADLPGTHPLVVMTHGTSRERQQREEVTPWGMLPQAVWFARRGWTVLVVVRRGYGTSGGNADFLGHRCPETDYRDAGEQSADDLRRAIEYGKTLPQVDGARIIATGVSTGGFAAVALTANAPAGLVAAINFAGGRGSQRDNEVCNPGDLVSAFRTFGKHSRTPMLWMYAENDKYFSPALAAKFDEVFRAGGGQDVFVRVPAFGTDGHSLFRQGIRIWSPIVDDFLRKQNLVLRAEPLPPPKAPDIAPPAELSEEGQEAFRSYLLAGPHKAFATSPHGFGYSAARITMDEARKHALENCRHASPKHESCRVVSTDNGEPGH